jgi:energy-coupling factor transporter ATP-binding protein EcfA2
MSQPDRLRLLDSALELPALAGEAPTLRQLARDAARMEELGSRPLRVALVGSTGAGKSTLLNALAGAPLAEEGTERPTSREAVAYAPEGVELGMLERTVGRVVRYAVPAEAPWGGQVFVDTPDLNSVVTAHADAALAVLDQVDVALVVLHRGSVAEARPAEALRPFARRRALLLVLNHADQLGATARATLANQAARVAVEVLGATSPPPVFVVSAARARQGLAGGDDWEALLGELRQLALAAVARNVRGRNAAGALGELREHIAAGLERTTAMEQSVQDALRRGLEAARTSLEEDFDARLDAAAAQLKAVVRRAAAARLSGPAAWGLRLSAWSGGGLLGGTLLARASLPAGLLVAASGALLDEVQSRTRARATRARVAGGDDPALEAQARAALAPARTAAQHCGVEPAVLGLPEPEAWAGQLEHARAAAWRDVEGFGVDQAVARWWRWARLLLIPLVQLPLLVLLGDVAWRTGRAYLFGPLLDVRFYVNAAALAAVWTAAGTLLAGLSLAGVAARVRHAGARRFSEGLSAAEASLQAQLEGALAIPRAAAEALLAGASGSDAPLTPSGGRDSAAGPSRLLPR